MAYAAVILVMQNLEEILHFGDSYPIYLNKDQIGQLLNAFTFLKLFLEDSQETRPRHDVDSVKNLETKIRDIAHKVADLIDSQIYIRNARQLSQKGFGWKQISLIAYQSFTQIVNQLKSVKLEAAESSETKVFERKTMAAVEDIITTTSSSSSSDNLVGIGADIEALLERLSGPESHRLVIPIVGMGGIGKTTLAQKIYYDPFVIYHFYVRAWITIPQAHTMSLADSMREMLLGLLKCFITNITDGSRGMTNEALGIKLYKALKGMRYLIVLDDMWRTQEWEILRPLLPDDNNRSRIILTSRLNNISGSPHRMDFLDADQSAQLLESKLLPKERYPPELNGIGRQIAVKCQGLPLAIVVVAGILNNIDMTSESWKKIIESVESVDFEYPEHCMNILALSYNYLPAYLKACFLYVGAFPRDGEIRVTRLTWLWIAEGLVLPVCGRLLEDVAEDYLEDLVNRNLIIVGKRRSNGRIKTCRVHDLLRDLCLREAHKEKFLCEVKDYTPTFLMKAIAPRRISLHSNILKSFSMYSMPLARTFLCYDMNQNLPDMFLLEAIDQMDFKLMRVLDIEPLRSNHLPVEILELIHLRFLALAVNCELPRSILKLQNLQTLIVDHIWEEQYLPWEIWRMTRLRHIRLKRGCNFPHPCRSNVEDEGPLVLENLQTLSNIIGPVSCSKEVFVRFPSLKKLGIVATESSTSSGFLGNLIWLNKLETLRCSFLYRHQNRLPSGHNFLVNLSKLTLVDSYLPWEDMSILALLPRLEVLKLLSFAFEGGKWIGVEGGFVKLKLLVVQNSDPSTWDADGSHFPKLEKLILRECHNLKWIPEGIGDIVTLKGIEVHDCSFCVMQSAWDIRYLQQELGNDEFFVRITLGGKYESDLPDYFVSSIKSLP